MDIYVMDENFDRGYIIDQYKSLIWTERYKEIGDFELVVPSTREFRALLPQGRYLTLGNVSTRVMRVEELEDTVDDDGARFMKVTGRSMESLFEDRSAMPALASTTTRAKWDITGVPNVIMETLFNTVYNTRPISSLDTFPFLQTGGFYPGTIAFPSESVTMSFEPDSLYNSIKKVADTYNIGFAIQLDNNGSEIEGVQFDTFMGNDKTSGQSTFAPVIFSESMDNLSKTKTLKSVAGYKNVAYVYTPNGYGIVYADGVESTISGGDRRVLTVNASDIDLAAGTALNAAIQQRGREELAKCKPIYAFDGEIPQNGGYKYGFSTSKKIATYDLGDLVEQRSDEGFITRMIVTEQIFASDEEGDRSYPTLVVDAVATPGSWSARSGTQVWAGVPDTEFWGTLE